MVEFAVNLNEAASDYFTVLVFHGIKSMMAGNVAGKKVIFSNVPAGEPVEVICIGVKDGKVVCARQSFKISSATIQDLQFEDITPEEFRKEAARMDK